VTHRPAITGSGVFTPENIITNAELVAAFNAYADRFNERNADAIAAGDVAAMEHSSEEFIVKASGIESRYVIDKSGVLDPEVMHPLLRQRSDEEPCLMAEMGVDAARKALTQAGREAKDVDGPCFEIRSTRCATEFSNNIRNNNGFLRRSRPDGLKDRRDMQFMQNGRKVFKEVLPMVSAHMGAHLADEGVGQGDIKRLWLHQANKTMNDFIGRKVMGREPEPGEQPNILQDYANTSSAGSIIAFSKYCDDFADGDIGMICSFGAGYSVGSVLLQRHG
jgi:3-oxoacyl-[acyl-carrier-protein] synthase III